jgi:hypothetical protein
MIQTTVRFLTPPAHLDPKIARWEFSLPAKSEFSFGWQISAEPAESQRPIQNDCAIDECRRQMDESYSRSLICLITGRLTRHHSG